MRLVHMRAFCLGLAAFLLVSSGAGIRAAEQSAALKELVAAASKEGKLELQWGSNLLGGAPALREMTDSMNKLFGSKVTLRFTPGANLNELLNAVALANAAGLPSPTDIVLGSNQHASESFKRTLSHTVDWPALLPGRIQASSVEAEGTAIRIFTTLPGGIIYNTQRAPYPPTKLEDLLKPEWKGKIASTPYGSGFDLLSASDVWGEERALDFARKLSKQITGLIRCNELQRVASGEFIAFAMDCLGREWLELQRKGAPVSHVVPADFAAQRFYYMMVPKNSQNPNAAKLFATFLHTPEGQKLLWKWTDTDLHTYSDGEMAKEVSRYEQKGVKFHQFTASWYMAHPEALEGLRKAVPILMER